MFCLETRTPIFRLNQNVNSNQLFVKRDDLLPFSFGGNKVRIAEEYFEDLERKGCDCIISYGSSKSNLNRVISNMSSAKNMPCYVVSPKEIDSEAEITFNRMLVSDAGADVVLCHRDNVADTIEHVINYCVEMGLTPYYIFGDKHGKGNEKIPAMAYIKAYEEILRYEKKTNTHFDYIFHASGTGMTQAGLICGNIMNRKRKKIIGISIARSMPTGVTPIIDSIRACFNGHFPVELNSEIFFIDKYICGGYGKFNNQISNTIKRVYSEEGIALDTTYTGKAFWGMTEYIKQNQISNSKILFIHTGGTPLFFENLEIIKSKENL